MPPRASVAEVVEALGTELPDGPTPAPEVIDLLANACEPGLTAMPSGRFYGLVIGGTHPAALAADWLVSAWDQNAALRQVTPGARGRRGRRERLAARPARPAGDTAASASSPARRCRTSPAWPPPATRCCAAPAGTSRRDGLSGAPRVRVLVGAERHDTVDLALRYLGLGAPEPVAADDQGRIDPDALAERARRSCRRERRRSSCCRRATCTPARSTRSAGRSRSRTATAPGCTSTARSACSPPRRRGPGTSRPATSRPTRGPPTRTRRSTCPTTAASRSSPTAPRCAPRWACTATT